MVLKFMSVFEQDAIESIIEKVPYKLSFKRMKQIIDFKYLMSNMPYDIQIIIYALTINKLYNLRSTHSPLITHLSKYDLRLNLRINYSRNCEIPEYYCGYIQIFDSMNINTRKLVYKGFISEGRKGNFGTEYYTDTTDSMKYKGGFNYNLYHGDGTLYYPNGVVKYEGEFNKNLYHGEGALYYPNGVVKYIGGFEYGSPNGEGEEYSLEGQLLVSGEYLDGFLHGPENEEYFTEGNLKYRGSYLYSKRDGYGIEFKHCGNLQYRGYFKDGSYHGQGILFHNEINSVQYRGSFINNLKDGYGILYNENEQFMYEGEFTEGQITN